MSDRAIRLRFAPSPTGQLHVGNARTALFNYLFARRHGGAFVLRIEDTDVERSTATSEASILEDLRWLGLSWDEGPDCSGPQGPYRQSERLDLYRRAAERLQAQGHAYLCFCSAEELEADRQQAVAAKETPRYGGKCRDLTPAQVEARLQRGEQPTVRFRVRKGEVAFNDLVHGSKSFDTAQFGDFVLIRSNGLPSYNFAVVVDDADMRISHVIRGDDHLTNTPKQLLIYRALDLAPPQFAHLSMILGPDHARLSKRHGATSVRQFRDAGILPEALVNFLALLGWSPGDDRELLTMDELVREFALARVGKSAAIFNPEKLAWMNGVYLRNTPAERLWEQAAGYLVAAGYLPAENPASRRAQILAALDLVKGSLKTVKEIADLGPLFFRDDPGWTEETLTRLATPDSRRVAAALLDRLDPGVPLAPESVRTAMKAVQKELGLGGKQVYPVVRLAVSGREHGPELDRLFCVLGGELVRRRLQRFAPRP